MMFYLLLLAVLAQGISGVAGEYALVADPSGAAVGPPLDRLEGTPSSDYLLSGAILFSVLGVFPLIVAWGLWQRRRWGWYGAVMVGAALAVWIIEIMMIGYRPEPPLQAIYRGLGVAMLSLASPRTVRRALSLRRHLTDSRGSGRG